MNKLLSANFFRMKNDKSFWIGMGFMFLMGIIIPVSHYLDMKKYGEPMYIDSGFFVSAVFIGIVASAFCSLFIGTEYSDGTIRNKVIVGQTRTAIYIANLITCAAASVFMCTASFISYLCVGIPLLGFFVLKTKTILLFVLFVFIVAITFSSIYTFIAMLNQKKATAAVISILSAFFLMTAASYMMSQLSQPQIYEGYRYIDEASGEVVEIESVENPSYVSGTKRKTYEFLIDFLPSGQAIKTAKISVQNPWLFCFYSGIIIIGTTGIGLVSFQKKDLN